MTTKPDYDEIVETEARKLGATVHDLLDFDAYSFEGLLYEGPRISEWPEEILYQAAWSDVATRQLFVKLPIEDDLGAVIAMHELGHIATTSIGTPMAGPEAVQVEAKATCWGLSHVTFPVSAGTATAMLAAIEEYAKATKQPIKGLAAKLKDKLLGLGATEESVQAYIEMMEEKVGPPSPTPAFDAA